MPIRLPRAAQSEEGFALLFVLFMAMALAALVLAAVSLSGNARLITAFEERQDELETVADAGLEYTRARLNSDRTLFPDSGYRTLENGVAVTGADGTAIPGVKRWTYAGPIGVSTGQYGVFGAVISVARYDNGDRVVRRADIVQESFAKYAYFTDVEPDGIAFGSGDQIQGPVHTNGTIKVYPSRATFRGPGTVTSVADSIVGEQYATFREGRELGVPRIELPRTAELERLRGYASQGGTAFVPPAGGGGGGGGGGDPRLRIEFIAIDLNGDSLVTGDDEGFFRVFESVRPDYLLARDPGNSAGWSSSQNCGYWRTPTRFVPAREMGGNNQAHRDSLRLGTRSRCYLGGAPELTNGFVEIDLEGPGSTRGNWRRRGFALSGALPAALSGRADADFLFPLSRRFNPDFKGVIHVAGAVAISGVLRGRVTIAAPDGIFVADDQRYATGTGGGNCADILGLFSGTDIVVLDNTLTTPARPNGPGNNPVVTLDETSHEFLDAVVLALDEFRVENHDGGPTSQEPCEGVARGRGCLYLAGGVIQRQRGPVGTTAGTGYLKRYSYDPCAYSNPPPYFPTTGRFSRSRYFEVDPAGFDVAAYFDRWSAGR